MSFSGIEKYIIGPYLFKIPNLILVVNLLDLSMIPQLSKRAPYRTPFTHSCPSCKERASASSIGYNVIPVASGLVGGNAFAVRPAGTALTIIYHLRLA